MKQQVSLLTLIYFWAFTLHFHKDIFLKRYMREKKMNYKSNAQFKKIIKESIAQLIYSALFCIQQKCILLSQPRKMSWQPNFARKWNERKKKRKDIKIYLNEVAKKKWKKQWQVGNDT